MSAERARKGTTDDRATSTGAVDRILTGLCAFVIVAVCAVLASSELNRTSAPAEFETHAQPVESLAGSYQLPVIVENVGGATATKVDVTAEVDLGGDTLTGTSTIDFLAPDERATAVFVFPRDPRDGTVSVGVRSYVEP